ncbi:Cytochrome oxidase biogenesis protein Sco1/SenC/PrrC, putative copper metallochaperone [Thioalkalivibrio nitratireducens DSM 14787]|uniref:Cytochrome oxidase biogenesis protein Sco1/SenC/PrrC, putative copper metallochaperone n=1 Tax=Thioalkalivibrio nitratireducens (strain DSM 14787 / UNIQEM 213 / ALEN2) TaxID=1255043 RepID=L0E1Y4_THIND|nr:SCO family protein [Thioalkalivibrio nitratireducens]AGA34651.1 Cytochrome oxidase biogenesis protein Sco1/SenC/PrrC, putative copper metallochaperone [Thioalkalivibrio nitratireducens DSM 14787]
MLMVLAGTAAFGAGLGGLVVSRSTGTTPDAERPEGLLWPQVRALPALELVSDGGQSFGTYDFQGAWSLVFVGYTSCPDICPMTLAQLNQMHRRVQEDARLSRMQTVFVSVDPERDSPQRLREYLGHFNDDFVGLTGDPAQLELLTRALGAVYMMEEPDAHGDYLIHHSSAIFLISPGAELAGILTGPHDPAGLAERLRAMLDFMQARA